MTQLKSTGFQLMKVSSSTTSFFPVNLKFNCDYFLCQHGRWGWPHECSLVFDEPNKILVWGEKGYFNFMMFRFCIRALIFRFCG